ncbi:MAG: dTDP-glucose 4,6-dehydratase [Chlamydiota bacterium]
MSLNLNDAHILVTGGAGFMGSNFIRFVLKQESFKGHLSNPVLLTYAGHLENLESIQGDDRYTFFYGDIRDEQLLEKIQRERPVTAIVHFAGETHVDRSIADPDPFIQTNIIGTYKLLEFVRKDPEIHFHHISTDEVYGPLGKKGRFTEESPYRPNSPYSASKAGSDHLVRAYEMTYKLSTTLSHASNNYGPGQYPEKFIPLIVQKILKKKEIPIYGTGENIREWLFVEDHARAVWIILQQGKKGEAYNIRGGNEMKNSDLLQLLFEVTEEITGEKVDRRLVTYIDDRPGHDFRYAMDGAKTERLGYRPVWSLKVGIRETIRAMNERAL